MNITKRIDMNQKMIRIVEAYNKENGSRVLQFEANKLKNLFFPNFVPVDDCIIISDYSQELLEEHFEKALKMYSDKTGYEAGNTEIRINDFLVNQINLVDAINLAISVIDCWALRLVNIDNNYEICFILSCDGDYVTLRFHRVRSGEKMWLSDSLDDYEEPVGCITIQENILLSI